MNRLCGITLAVAFAMAVTLGACGSTAHPSHAPSPSTSTSSTAAPTTGGMPSAAAGATITIHDFSFGRAITVRAGATVHVHNADSTTHSLSSDDGRFAAGESVPAGETHTFTAPTKPGTYPFHCNFHAEMHGTLIVTA